MHELIRVECPLYREHCTKSGVFRLAYASQLPVGLFRNKDVQFPPTRTEGLFRGRIKALVFLRSTVGGCDIYPYLGNCM